MRAQPLKNLPTLDFRACSSQTLSAAQHRGRVPESWYPLDTTPSTLYRPLSVCPTFAELSSATAAAAAASAAGAGQSAPAPEAGGPGRVSASSAFSAGIISAIQTAVTKNVAAIARAAFKSVTYPETNGYQPYQGDLQYSQINGQVR